MTYRPHIPISDATVRSLKLLAADEKKPVNGLIGELLLLGFQHKYSSIESIKL